MATMKLIGFGGEVPKLQPRQLPDTHAQYAFNCRLESGALIPINNPAYVDTVASYVATTAKTIYKYQDKWIGWDKVVNAAPAPVAEDRMYYTGDGKPKMRIGTSIYDLGVPFPSTALTVATATPSGVTLGTDVVSRIYVYTNVTAYGEESEPSPASATINWQSGMTVTLSGFALPSVSRNVTKHRIYRTQTGSSGDTNLYFIAERDVTNADYVDSIDPTAIGERIPSIGYTSPPDNLEGLISLPNGMMAGFVGKKLYFCEPYIPHAWPEKYILTTEYEIMGIGAFGSSIAVITTGYPYVADGTAPENMTMARLETNLPCVNKRGIVDMGYGIAYPSADGLVMIQSGSASVITSNIITRQDWKQLSPETFISGLYNGRYIASYSYYDNVGVQQLGSIIIDIANGTPFLVRSDLIADAFCYDVETSSLMFARGTNVYEYDPYGGEPGYMIWKSKLFTLPAPVNMGAMMVDGGTILSDDQKAAYEAAKAAAAASNQAIFNGVDVGTVTVIPFVPLKSVMNGQMIGSSMLGTTVTETWTDVTINGVMSMRSEVAAGLINEFALGGEGMNRLYLTFENATVRIFANESEIYLSKTLNDLVRLPASIRARFWEVQIEGNATIYEVDIASTVSELRTI